MSRGRSLEGGGVEGAREEANGSASYDWSDSEEEAESLRGRLDIVCGIASCTEDHTKLGCGTVLLQVVPRDIVLSKP